jgi:hypothetical protein
LAVKRPARTSKIRIQTGKFTMEKAEAFNRPGRRGPAATGLRHGRLRKSPGV